MVRLTGYVRENILDHYGIVLFIAFPGDVTQVRCAGDIIHLDQRMIDYARANAGRLGMADRAQFRLGDWAAGIDARFDLILANPPYIGTEELLPPQVRDHEPASALFAGADGLDDYRRIVPELPRLIAPGGIALLEIGWTQAEAVSALASRHGLKAVLHRDLGERPRALALS